eukprot:g22942.t1
MRLELTRSKTKLGELRKKPGIPDWVLRKAESTLLFIRQLIEGQYRKREKTDDHEADDHGVQIIKENGKCGDSILITNSKKVRHIQSANELFEKIFHVHEYVKFVEMWTVWQSFVDYSDYVDKMQDKLERMEEIKRIDDVYEKKCEIIKNKQFEKVIVARYAGRCEKRFKFYIEEKVKSKAGVKSIRLAEEVNKAYHAKFNPMWRDEKNKRYMLSMYNFEHTLTTGATYMMVISIKIKEYKVGERSMFINLLEKPIQI